MEILFKGEEYEHIQRERESVRECERKRCAGDTFSIHANAKITQCYNFSEAVVGGFSTRSAVPEGADDSVL